MKILFPYLALSMVVILSGCSQNDPSSRGTTLPKPEITLAAKALAGTYWKEVSRDLIDPAKEGDAALIGDELDGRWDGAAGPFYWHFEGTESMVEYAAGSTVMPVTNGYFNRSLYAIDIERYRLLTSLSSLGFAAEVTVEKLTDRTIQVSYKSRSSEHPIVYRHVFARFYPDSQWLEWAATLPALEK